jgi:hypothetical protein
VIRGRRVLALAAPALLLLSGCAQQVVSVAPPPRPRAPVVALPIRPGFAIAASAGTTDAVTRDLAAELARRTGFVLVAAPGATADVVPAWEAAHGPIAFYAEVRETDRRASGTRIAIATVGVDDNLAARLRTLYELIRDAYVRAHPGTPTVDVLVEPAAASPARAGAARVPARALHLALPRVARIEAREPYTAILADFLSQAAMLPAGR